MAYADINIDRPSVRHNRSAAYKLVSIEDAMDALYGAHGDRTVNVRTLRYVLGVMPDSREDVITRFQTYEYGLQTKHFHHISNQIHSGFIDERLLTRALSMVKAITKDCKN